MCESVYIIQYSYEYIRLSQFLFHLKNFQSEISKKTKAWDSKYYTTFFCKNIHRRSSVANHTKSLFLALIFKFMWNYLVKRDAIWRNFRIFSGRLFLFTHETFCASISLKIIYCCQCNKDTAMEFFQYDIFILPLLNHHLDNFKLATKCSQMQRSDSIGIFEVFSAFQFSNKISSFVPSIHSLTINVLAYFLGDYLLNFITKSFTSRRSPNFAAM